MRTAVIVVCFICPNCLSLRDNAACCIPLRDLRNLRENKHASVLNQSTQKKPQCLPLISQIYADKQQNRKTSPNCLSSLRNNAACCIPLCVICVICGRIFTQEDSIYIAQMNPKYSPADLADLRRQNPKQQNNNNSINLKQPVFLCDIYCTNEPQVFSRRSRRFTQTKPKTAQLF